MLEFSPYQPTDEAPVCDIWMQAFDTTADYWPHYTRRMGPENLRVLRSESGPMGVLGVYRMGQWFGGRCVPCGGLAGVAIAPEFRQRGGAKRMLTGTLRELREQGVPLAALYASSQAVYRGVGFEQSGSRCQYELSLRHVGLSDRTLTARRVALADPAPFADIHHQRALRENGHLERTPGLWERLLVKLPADTQYGYVVEEQGRPAGYVIYYLDDAGPNEPTKIFIRDWCALTPGAAVRLWTLIADHSSIVESVHWYGPANDPMLAYVAECKPSMMKLQRWMLRVLDVPAALAQRGYPGVTGDLHLEVSDPVFVENQGRFVLSVKDGTASVEPGGRGELQCTARGLAPLYTGMFSAATLVQLGWLSGTPEALATATRVFAGPEPWMPEYF
ncbi:MAG: GNAT family N-acetyltransferase [Planctomycetaceae bacterium]|nr:GNAT family N-acetyltransferase [Planctomycetaceae bacterium]